MSIFIRFHEYLSIWETLHYYYIQNIYHIGNVSLTNPNMRKVEKTKLSMRQRKKRKKMPTINIKYARVTKEETFYFA